MNKKISTSFALVVIIVIAGFFVSVFYFGGKHVAENSNSANNSSRGNKIKRQNNKDVACKAHYYNGEEQIAGWKAGENEQGGVLIKISNSDLAKLPVSADKAVSIDSNATINLVDPSADLKDALDKSSDASPVEITIKGYAETCDSMIPSVSLSPIGVTLKKS